MADIHPSAVIDPKAELGERVTVGAYTLIGAHVRIGEGTTIGPHCVVEGHTTIGADNRIFQFVSVGAPPQDKKYAGEPTELHIGNGNTIREFCTLNTGTALDEGVTRLGDDNWVMAYVHVAHDCQVGSHTILANAVQLAGHVHIGDWAILGGLTGVHQFVRVGPHAMAGFSTRLSQDLPPFVMAAGNPARAQGFNQEGLRRRGFSAERVGVVRKMHRALYRRGLTLDGARAEIEALRSELPEALPDVELMLGFLAAAERGIVR
jgi:UDP-N-acetylglucosamine acyltransferase